jgi:osmotically-inducible protein OsmY
MNRPDDILLDHIWRSLWNEETIHAIDIQDISVVVENGQACLSGHVSQNTINQRIEEIIRSIPGVISIHNHLVADNDLSNQVVRVLGENESTRPFTLPVSCKHGWVELGGIVPNREIQHTAEETAASVAAVRGVILLPTIKGENPSLVRDAVQPRISVRVYGDDENEETVYQVVVNPQNRLVTHAIVRVNQFVYGGQKVCDYLLPVEAMRLVGACGIFLIHRAPVSDQFPILISANYPFAPLTWLPPYPYAVGSVRWPSLENVKQERIHEISLE